MALVDGKAWLIDASSGAPAYSGANVRREMSALLSNGTANPFGARAGRRPGAGLNVTAGGGSYFVDPGSFIAVPGYDAAQSAYLVAFESAQSDLYTAAAANPRIDLIQVRVDDQGYPDGSGNRRATIVYKAGVPNASPVAPAPDARCNVLATMLVPVSGSPTVTMMPPAVASGGVVPILSAELATIVQYAGMKVFAVDTGIEYVSCDGEFARTNDAWQDHYVSNSSYAFSVTATAVGTVISNGGPYTRRVPRNRSLEVMVRVPLIATDPITGCHLLLKINGQYVETHYQSNSNANPFGAGVTLIGTYERGNNAPATISFQVEAVREGAAGPVVVGASPQGPGMVKIKSRIV